MQRAKLILMGLAGTALGLWSSCSQPERYGRIDLQLTDSPLYDEQVAGVYITIDEVYIDGQYMEGWSGRRSIDLMTLQNGGLLPLGQSELTAKQHSHIRLVLNNLQDEQGQTPGCYVLLQDGSKKPLSEQARSEPIAVQHFEIMPERTNPVVLDFDARKAIRRDDAGNFRWVAPDALRNALRAFNLHSVGKVHGQCQIPPQFQNDRLVLYGYIVDTFNYNQEVYPDEQGITFRNAWTSCRVAPDGNFVLGFVPEADLDIKIARYTLQNGAWQFAGFLSGQGRDKMGNAIPLTDFSVYAGMDYRLNIVDIQ